MVKLKRGDYLISKGHNTLYDSRDIKGDIYVVSGFDSALVYFEPYLGSCPYRSIHIERVGKYFEVGTVESMAKIGII